MMTEIYIIEGLLVRLLDLVDIVKMMSESELWQTCHDWLYMKRGRKVYL